MAALSGAQGISYMEYSTQQRRVLGLLMSVASWLGSGTVRCLAFGTAAVGTGHLAWAWPSLAVDGLQPCTMPRGSPRPLHSCPVTDAAARSSRCRAGQGGRGRGGGARPAGKLAKMARRFG